MPLTRHRPTRPVGGAKGEEGGGVQADDAEAGGAGKAGAGKQTAGGGGTPSPAAMLALALLALSAVAAVAYHAGRRGGAAGEREAEATAAAYDGDETYADALAAVLAEPALPAAKPPRAATPEDDDVNAHFAPQVDPDVETVLDPTDEGSADEVEPGTDGEEPGADEADTVEEVDVMDGDMFAPPADGTCGWRHIGGALLVAHKEDTAWVAPLARRCLVDVFQSSDRSKPNFVPPVGGAGHKVLHGLNERRSAYPKDKIVLVMYGRELYDAVINEQSFFEEQYNADGPAYQHIDTVADGGIRSFPTTDPSVYNAVRDHLWPLVFEQQFAGTPMPQCFGAYPVVTMFTVSGERLADVPQATFDALLRWVREPSGDGWLDDVNEGYHSAFQGNSPLQGTGKDATLRAIYPLLFYSCGQPWPPLCDQVDDCECVPEDEQPSAPCT